MIRKLVIPEALGEVEVRLLDWLKAEGDIVSTGDALLEFETDKAIVVVTASENGVVRRVLWGSDDWMMPGEVVALLTTTADEALPEGDVTEGDLLQVAFDVT